MVYKRIKRSGGPSKVGGPNDKKQFKNKIGEATAKKMQDKLGKMARKGKDKDEDEIKSNESDDYVDREPTGGAMNKRNALLNDPFL